MKMGISCASVLKYIAPMLVAGFFQALAPIRCDAQPIEFDVKIVISVDASGSVDPDEFVLQINGIAQALRDPSVQQAVQNGPHQKVLAALLVWSDAAYPKYTTTWSELHSADSFEAFAKEIESFTVTAPGVPAIGGGGTNIGDGLLYAITMITEHPDRAARRVIDISGDGPESKPWLEGAVEMPQARAVARRENITVNGLAIEKDIANLHQWYQENMIVGAGAFVERAQDFKDFQRAMTKKLLRELSSTPLVMLEQ